MKRGDTLATYNGYTVRLPLNEALCGCPILTSQIVRWVHDKHEVFQVVQCAGCGATWRM